MDGAGTSGDNADGKCPEHSGTKSRLSTAMGVEGVKKWPKMKGAGQNEDSTEQISGEMIGLTADEREKTARLFARTVEVRCSIYISKGTGV